MKPETLSWRGAVAPGLSLLASAATLACCALPALLVALGLGAVLAGLVVAAPWLVILSAHKLPLFAGAGGLLLAAALSHRRSLRLPCPADPSAARACARLRRLSSGLLAASAVLWGVGAVFAFLAAPLLF